MSVKPLPLRWIPRREPLAAAAIAARGEVATELAERLVDRPDASLAALRGVAGIAWVVVLGAEVDLPWVDGVVLLGADPRAPSLLIPTTLDADVPLPLVARALLVGAHREPPLAVLPSDATVVSVAAARALDRAAIASWLRGRGAAPRAGG